MKKILFISLLLYIVSLCNVYAQYDSTEVAKLRYFLLQESAEKGVKNYQQLGIANIDSVDWRNVRGLYFNNLTHLLERLYWAGNKLSGDADFSDFKSLEYLYLSYNKINSINVANSSSLIILDLYENNLDLINVETNINLSYLRLGFNNLRKVDVSNNPNLTFFCCTNNMVDSLNLSGKSLLVSAYCMFNKLKYIDITNCPKLQTFTVYNNKLEKLDLTGLSSLSYLSCCYNNLLDLDFSDCVSLKKLDCYDNNLTNLDVSYCNNIDSLNCNNNNIHKLNLSGASKLKALYCNNNQLDSLNIDDCKSLSYIDCGNNNLSYLTLPKIVTGLDPYIYYPQSSISFEAEYDSVDVSFVNDINGIKSTYTWNKGLSLAHPVKSEGGFFAFDESMIGKTLICRVQNMAFPNLVMRYNVTIKNKGDVGNASVSGIVSVYGGSGCLYITATSAVHVYVYSVLGALVAEEYVGTGRTVLNLPRGLYVVRTNNSEGTKVIVK